MEVRRVTTVTLTADEVRDLIADHLNDRADMPESSFEACEIMIAIPEVVGEPSLVSEFIAIAETS